MHLVPGKRPANEAEPEIGNSGHFRKRSVRCLLEGIGLAGSPAARHGPDRSMDR